MTQKQKILIASDHAGWDLKKSLMEQNPNYDWEDLGAYNKDKVDYPVFAQSLCHQIQKQPEAYGVLVCASGQGMSITANRFAGIRASLCWNKESAHLARAHNNAQVLCLGSQFLPSKVAHQVFKVFMETKFESGRHLNRIKLIDSLATNLLVKTDPEIFSAIGQETNRQKNGLELIASENYTSQAVLTAQGSILTNKYAEGYPGRRYYGGCKFVDVCESLAIERAKKLFHCEHANVQAHSGSQANMAVYFSVLQPKDLIMGMSLSNGGHLTHGSPVNFSGSIFRSIAYGADPQTGLLDYNHIEQLAKKHKPKLLVAGYSAYPRQLDFQAFRTIADRVGAILLVDMAHFAGLVAGKVHPSPVAFADFITSTTHKTLRGPRGGLILCSKENSKKLNQSIFPGIQGGPLMHVIAGKAIAFKEAMQSSFKKYAKDIVTNAQTLAKALQAQGFSLVTGGTDNHLILIDLSNQNITGKQAEQVLEQANITVNKNTVPGETKSPFVTSGIRIGTPAVTTRGMGTTEMKQIANWIAQALKEPNNTHHLKKISNEVAELCSKFFYPG